MRKCNCLLMALLFSLIAAPAMAVLDSSHHDIPVYNTSFTVKDKCFICHGVRDTNDATSRQAAYGVVGAFCLTRCHTAAGLIGGGGAIQPQAPNANGGSGDTWSRPAADYSIVAFTSAHGDNTAKTFYGASAASSVASTSWPYTGGTKMECTSCHAVHDNQNTPFIWVPLTSGGTVNNGFCDRCHTERGNNNMATNPGGNHPVDFAVNYAAATGRTGGTSGGTGTQPDRHGRTINLDWSSATLGAGVFDVPTTNGSALSGAQSAAMYSTGGHLGNFGQYAGTAEMGCYTCHAAHQPGTATNNLVVVTTFDATGWNPLCMGCHGASTTWANNQTDNAIGSNGSAYYGHPVGINTDYASSTGSGTGQVATYNVSVGGFSFTLPIGKVEAANTQNGIQFGSGGEVMCTSCHDVHLGVNGTKAIASLGQAAGTAVCMACHDGSELADAQDQNEGGTGESINSHHRTTTVGITGAYLGPGDANTLNINTTWVTEGPQNMGDLADGLQCADCHQFNGTAHNWP